MGAIKDIVDLTSQLSVSVKDRQLAAEILKIQTLILAVQRDDAEVVSENLELKKKVFELEKINQGLVAEISNLQLPGPLQDKYAFNKSIGVYMSKESGHYFCTSCLLNNIESPLSEKQSGWRCERKGCNKFYVNPSWQPPKHEPPIYFQKR